MLRFFRNLWLLLTTYDIALQMEFDRAMLESHNKVVDSIRTLDGVARGEFLPPRSRGGDSGYVTIADNRWGVVSIAMEEAARVENLMKEVTNVGGLETRLSTPIVPTQPKRGKETRKRRKTNERKTR